MFFINKKTELTRFQSIYKAVLQTSLIWCNSPKNFLVSAQSCQGGHVTGHQVALPPYPRSPQPPSAFTKSIQTCLHMVLNKLLHLPISFSNLTLPFHVLLHGKTAQLSLTQTSNASRGSGSSAGSWHARPQFPLPSGLCTPAQSCLVLGICLCLYTVRNC